MRESTQTRQPRFALGIRARLMLFLVGICMFTLLMVWALVINFLQPRYNQYLKKQLEIQLSGLMDMIDASDEPISSRDFFTLTLNSDFWNGVNEAIQSGLLDFSGCCVDISDTTLRSVNHIENVHPCLIHNEQMSSFSSYSGLQDSVQAIRLRKQLFEQGELYTILNMGETSSQMVVGRLSANGQYAVLVSTGLARIDEAGVVLGQLLPYIALFLLALCFAASWLFSRWFTRPLTQLSEAAKTLAQGNYDVQVTVDSDDEVGALARDFNYMAGEVKRSVELQKDIVANVSHDLRTPLTLIRGYAETVRDLTGDDADKRTEQLNIIVDETERLSALVNSVMDMSKFSSGAQKPHPVQFDMSQLCFEVAGRYDAVCAQNGWTLQLEADSECPVEADPEMMERVLHNLLGNAMHHIGEDGVFVLRAIPHEGGGCRIEVEDHGPGIKPEDMPHLFDRYYRSRQDAGRPGTGLGLSITKAILQAHGYGFGVNSTLGKGSTFWFEMTAPSQPPRLLAGK